MSIDPAWEAEHARREWGRWPHQAAVEFVCRHYPPKDWSIAQRPVAYDIGCGVGAASWLLARQGFIVNAIDGSGSAVSRAAAWMDAERLSHLVGIQENDVVALDWPLEYFDCVVDVCCLSCLPFDQAEHVIMKAHGWLKPGGRMLSVMASTECDEGVHAPFTVRQIDRAGIDLLFGGFRDLFVGKHTRLTRRGFISEWVVEVQK